MHREVLHVPGGVDGEAEDDGPLPVEEERAVRIALAAARRRRAGTTAARSPGFIRFMNVAYLNSRDLEPGLLALREPLARRRPSTARPRSARAPRTRPRDPRRCSPRARAPRPRPRRAPGRRRSPFGRAIATRSPARALAPRRRALLSAVALAAAPPRRVRRDPLPGSGPGRQPRVVARRAARPSPSRPACCGRRGTSRSGGRLLRRLLLGRELDDAPLGRLVRRRGGAPAAGCRDGPVRLPLRRRHGRERDAGRVHLAREVERPRERERPQQEQRSARATRRAATPARRTGRSFRFSRLRLGPRYAIVSRC